MYLDGEATPGATHTYVFAAQVHDSSIAIFCFLKQCRLFIKICSSNLRNLHRRNLVISAILKGCGTSRKMPLYCLIKNIV